MNGRPDQLHVNYVPVSPLFHSYYEPTYASEGAAGMDLHACIEAPLSIEPGKRVRVPTGIALQWHDAAVVALVYARSGLAWRFGIGLPNGVGVIDSDYTGELQVLLANFGDDVFTIQPGDRIAQVVFTPVYRAQLARAAELRETSRGTGGFGSTGVAATKLE
ncbi:dUTP diphosphatase [Alicyclobacillus sp. ALC3]|uniref:dUTP diphosphatase n=1 Tax=Alicyclobacillus sp. ALC3 TaxID=2796143 RepID=UPI0023794D55|nr:dUTP diphosphatase [Alicyclobacillus sp. ALC3]